MPVDEYTKDPILAELITMIGTGQLAPQAAQAAVWNRTDNMSWQQLAAKFSYDSLRRKVPYFSGNDIRGAQMITSAAVVRIKEREEANPVVKAKTEEPPVRSRVR